jgi:hypothetical protein
MKMPDKIKKQLEVLKDTINNGVEKGAGEEMKDLAPSGMGWLRAGVASIPIVGGGLDHLLFDKYAEIQQKNIQQAIDAMKEKMATMEEQKVSKDWFESEEALDMLRNLLQRIMYEGDDVKIKALSYVYCQFGTIEHKDDPNKYAVLDTISKLTNNQRVVFKAVNEVVQETKTVSEGALEYTATAKWQSTILDYCNSNTTIRSQLRGPVLLDVELDILMSFNLIVNLDVGSSKDSAFRVSALGRLAYSYLKDA